MVFMVRKIKSISAV